MYPRSKGVPPLWTPQKERRGILSMVGTAWTWVTGKPGSLILLKGIQGMGPPLPKRGEALYESLFLPSFERQEKKELDAVKLRVLISGMFKEGETLLIIASPSPLAEGNKR